MSITKGNMIKAKFSNFCRFCKTYLEIDQDCSNKLDAMDKLPAELIIATLQEPLQVCQEAIQKKDVQLLCALMEDKYGEQKTLTLPFLAADYDQKQKLWRYLECFSMLVINDFSE